jgi:hypothetical protein
LAPFGKTKSAGPAHWDADLRFQKAVNAHEESPPAKKAGAKLFSHDSKRRDDESLYSNYTFTTLIDRFTSLRTTMHNFMVVKEPTYKI